MRYFPVVAFCFCHIVMVGQSFELADQIPFFVDGKKLDFPLTGGMNAPQFSATDLNNDGIRDLYVFDRAGDVHLTFLNDGIPDSASYRYAPAYASSFPLIDNWALLRDYDGDGIEDLFAFSDVPGISGMRVHRGFFENDTLRFARVQFGGLFNLVTFRLPSGTETPLFISNIDYPAVDDIDCDGDLDILTFNLSGGFIEFYANQSVELGYGRDSLRFALVENCWGGIFESGISEVIDLAESAGGCARESLRGSAELEFRHTGSTLLTFDMNGDGDKELLVGDISFDNLNLLTNGGNCEQAWLSGQEPFFPEADLPIAIPSFPAGFYLDLNNDGKRDLLTAPNTEAGGEDVELTWLYRNIGTEEQPDFRFVTQTLFVEEMVDLGTASHPAFLDYNADGLMDLVVGNYSVFSRDGLESPGLWLFENQGDLTSPGYVLVDDNYLGTRRFSEETSGFAPRFRDLDGDGDVDAILGLQFGGLLFAENLAGPGQPVSFGLWENNFQGIDVGLAGVPEVFDFNEDGLPDLLMGERSGNINYFENKGRVGAPEFDSLPTDQFWGLVDTRDPGFFLGHSAPFVLETEEEEPLLVTGTHVGYLKMYRITGNNEPFELLNEQFGAVRPGEQTSIDLADIDGDGLLEMAVGNIRGGLTLYETELEARSIKVSSTDRRMEHFDRVVVYPNPNAGQLQIKNPGAFSFQFVVYDHVGRTIKSGLLPGGNTRINLEALDPGIYWLELSSGKSRQMEKIVLFK